MVPLRRLILSINFDCLGFGLVVMIPLVYLSPRLPLLRLGCLQFIKVHVLNGNLIMISYRNAGIGFSMHLVSSIVLLIRLRYKLVQGGNNFLLMIFGG